MNYPLISEYIEAIKSSEENFEELTNLRPILSDDGQLVMTSGNFAVVFKMEDIETGKLYALKCFTKEQEGREEAYKQIAEELEGVDSPYIVPIKYLEKELFVDSKQTDETEFPVLLMDWVEGKTLDKYLRENLDDKYALEMLAYRFSQLAQWLIPQPFAHGDLKPDNILVRDDGTLVLVDYDGMYVPTMKGQKARELGSPDFRHPLRTENDFDEHIDDFPIVSILLSLKAISLNPQLLEEYGAADRLLFSENDFCDIANSNTMRCILGLIRNKEIAKAYSLFVVVLSEKRITQNSFSLVFKDKFQEELYDLVRFQSRFDNDIKFYRSFFLMNGLGCERDVKRAITLLMQLAENDYTNAQYLLGVCYQYGQGIIHNYEKSIKWYTKAAKMGHFGAIRRLEKATTDDLKNAWTDEYGVMYSADRTRLLKAPEGIVEYKIKKNTLIVCDNAFKDCRKLSSIELPATIISIGDLAFQHCIFKTIQLPDSLIHIGGCAFTNNEDLTYINFPPNLREIPIHNIIGGCKRLNDIKIETPLIKEKEGVLYSNDFKIVYSYLYQSNVLSIDLDNRAEIISSNAFWGSEIESIRLPKSLKIISQRAFTNCRKLHSINLPSFVNSIEGVTFFGCESLKVIDIPKNVTSIGDSAFRRCNSLTSIRIPDSVTEIGEYAFEGCSNLPSVEIPNSVTKIGKSAFWGCSGMTSINIPDSVTEIGDSAFWGCSGLMSITIPKGVTCIGAYAFHDCSNLTSIVIPDSVTKIGESAFGGCSGMTSINIPDSVTEIGEGAFWGCSGMTSINIPDSVTEIGDSAFRRCNSLTSIRIPDSVTKIGEYAFEGCSNLPSVEIPNSVTKIGKSAFWGCSGMTSINIPDSVTEIGEGAFQRCTSLTNITVASGNSTYDSRNGCNAIIETNSNTLIAGCKNTIIPSSVTKIGESAFGGCSGLTSIFIPSKVFSIGESAFSYCSGLTSIQVATPNLFYTSDNSNALIFNDIIEIEKSVLYILVRGCLKTKIPDYVTNIDAYAFSGCKGLKTITIPNRITSIGAYAFVDCSDMTQIIIPNNVKSLGDCVFLHCCSLTSIVIQNSALKIGRDTFYGCTNLKTIYIPEGTREKFEQLLPHDKNKLVEQK